MARRIIRDYLLKSVRIQESKAFLRITGKRGFEQEIEPVISDSFKVDIALEMPHDVINEIETKINEAIKLKDTKKVYRLFIQLCEVALHLEKQVQLEIYSESLYNANDIIYISDCKVYEKPRNEEIKSPRILLKDIPDIKLEYCSLSVGFGNYVHVQRDGFMLYCALTGEGKTYFAIDNLRNLQKQFNQVVIFAYEITANDYLTRLANHFKISKDEVRKEFGNIIIDTTKNFDAIIREYKTHPGPIAFIVDNIDNLPLEAEGSAFYQSVWLKEFDYFIKQYGHFAVILSQMKKTDARVKKEELTVYDVAGSKDRVDLSRTVIFTFFDEDNKRYRYKPLKYGTMERFSEIFDWHPQ